MFLIRQLWLRWLTGGLILFLLDPVEAHPGTFGLDPYGRLATVLNGANLRTPSYGRNELNQYTSITQQGYLDVNGVVWATNTVTVNGQATDRKGEYWHTRLSVANTNQPVLQSVSAVSGSTTNSGFALVPPSTRPLSYDHDGDLTADGLWTYTWDGENRLTKVESATTLVATNRLKVEFQYDHQGRRVSKKSYTHNGSAWVLKDNLLLLYDGWNLLAELNPTNKALIRSYAWDLDLANAGPGDAEGAGGIGGLVLVKSHVSPTGSHFPGYDGNGNVTALVDTTGSLTARYEYGPFGEPITTWGTAAKLNPFRWSTKVTDNETDLLYYGYRYYSPSLGRWTSRDPIEEEDGTHLYAFVRNQPLNSFDLLGRLLGTLLPNPGQYETEAAQAQQALSFQQRIQRVVDAFNDVSEITADLMDAIQGDPSDIMMRLLSGGNNPLSRLVGRSPDDVAFERHHLIPQQFKKGLQGILGDSFDINKFTVNLEKRFHQRLVHGNKDRSYFGGVWNRAWGQFLGWNGREITRHRRADELGEFMQGLLGVLTGF